MIIVIILPVQFQILRWYWLPHPPFEKAQATASFQSRRRILFGASSWIWPTADGAVKASDWL